MTSSRASATLDRCRREAAHGIRFGAEGFEHRHKFRDDEQIVDALGQVQQLQGSTLPADRRERAHDLANPRAVDVRHVAQIEEEVLASLVQQAVNLVFEQRIAIAERQFAFQIDLHLNPPIRVTSGYAGFAVSTPICTSIRLLDRRAAAHRAGPRALGDAAPGAIGRQCRPSCRAKALPAGTNYTRAGALDTRSSTPPVGR